jgi:hypothetical protein
VLVKDTRNTPAIAATPDNLAGGVSTTHSSRKIVGNKNLSTASQHLSQFYQHAITNQSMSHSTSRFSVAPHGVINALEPPPPLPVVKHQPTNKFYDTTFSKAFVSHQ